ncbi:MAG: hypothetical protein ACYCQJ_02605 [Nitrososphaerales archaeon]
MSEEGQGVSIAITAEDEFTSTFSDLVSQSNQASETLGGLTTIENDLSTSSSEASSSLSDFATNAGEITSFTDQASSTITTLGGDLLTLDGNLSSLDGSLTESTTDTDDFVEALQNANDQAESDAIQNLNNEASNTSSTFKDSAQSIAGTAGAMGSLATSAYGLNDAYTRQEDANLRLTSAQNNLVKAQDTVKNATLTLQTAQTHLNLLIAEGITTGPQYQAAQDAVTKAQNGLNNANLQLQNSQNNLTSAQNRSQMAAQQVQMQWLMMGTSTIPMLLTQLPEMAAFLFGVGAAEDQLTISQVAQSAATGIASGAMTIFDAVMDANPIMLVVLAIAGLVAIIGIATDGFRNWTPVINVVHGAFNDFIQVGKDIESVFTYLFGNEINTWSSALQDFWSIIQPIVQGVQSVVNGMSTITNAGGSIGNSLSNAGNSISNAIGSVIPGFASGGIVTQPTLAMIGEEGPEAVVPLSSSNLDTSKTMPLGSAIQQTMGQQPQIGSMPQADIGTPVSSTESLGEQIPAVIGTPTNPSLQGISSTNFEYSRVPFTPASISNSNQSISTTNNGAPQITIQQNNTIQNMSDAKFANDDLLEKITEQLEAGY